MFDRNDLVGRGLARWYRGRLIPIMQGGDESAPEPIFADVPEDLAALSDEELEALHADFTESVDEVAANPRQFVASHGLTVAELLDQTQAAADVRDALKAEIDRRAGKATVSEEPEATELSDEEQAAFAALNAAQADPEPEPDPEPEAAVTAAASSAHRPGRAPRPSAEREMREHEAAEPRAVALTAAGGAPDMQPGQRFTSEHELAEAMCRRHEQFGQTGPGTVERFAIAKANWRDDYPADRRLRKDDIEANFDIVKPVINQRVIKEALRARKREQDSLLASGLESLIASGGLCAPVTPWYNLQYISVPIRPVQGALPSFNADRGGLRYARPAALSAVTTGVGLITEAEDFAGGSMATKSCQVIPCPPFQETDVDIIYHCLQFGNLGARAFPELVAQWNNLVLAAHARLAESNLLTMIDAFSTQVTAASLGLGAAGALFGQILTAAEGLRSRNRMDPEAVLRVMLPYWAVPLIVSDVIRSQFERFDTDQAAVIAMFRSFNIEPTFYIDSAAGRAQVYGTQGAGALLPFPATVTWYLFPEGSFLYLDSGMLELGIVRDSVLNKTNDFQIFGETFENVAYVGVESLAVTSTTCDSGTVSLPASVTCPVNYA